MTEFALTRDQLKFLVRDRDSDSVQRISDFGGVRGIAKKLLIDPSIGVDGTPQDIKLRSKAFGLNYVPPPEPRSYLSFLKDAFGDITIIILCVSAIVDLGIAIGYTQTTTSYAESSAILVSIIVVTNVAAANDFRKQSQFRKLNAVVENMGVIVVRNGQKISIPTNDIVVGDVVTISVGDIICADGLLVEGHGIETDESSLTGETRTIRKDVGKNPFLLSGTRVMEGTGLFLVIAVGEHSEAGQIRMIVQGRRAGKSSDKSDSHPDEAENSEEETKSVLTNKLDTLATNIGKGGTLVATLCFIVMVVRFSITRYVVEDSGTECAVVGGALCASQEVISLHPEGILWPTCQALNQGLSTCCEDTAAGATLRGSPCPWLKVHIGEFIGFFITAVTILVVAVPEGLPLAVTLSLAFSVIKMQADNNLVKHLDACETMGSATTICSDKTGTLTKNRMTVMRSFIAEDSFKASGSMPVGLAVLGFVESEYSRFPTDVDGRKLVPPGTRVPGSFSISPKLVSVIGEGVAVNSTGDIKWDPKTKLWEQIGNKTDCALLQLITDLGVDYAQIRSALKPYIVKSFPFNSAKKRSTVIMRSSQDTSFRVHVKGASEMVLELCTHIADCEGNAKKLTNEEFTRIRAKISEYASLAMRTICIAYKTVKTEEDWERKTDDFSYACESDLTLLAIVGIEDPLRDEVPNAILRCRGAGVDVRMVTGDNLDTAVAIAKGCGILRPADLDSRGNPKANTAITGPDFRKRVVKPDGDIDQSEFDKIWPHLRVLARSSPTDKFTLVSGLGASELFSTARGRRLAVYPDKQVVAVTGDGTNDAPALKKADVGFAMGITGTAVAKEAADIILMDDNFTSIVKAIMWGRNVHEGIAKFLQFQLTINIVALVLAIEGSLVYSESPLKAVQMLWVNLIMDSLASLALATEMPTEEHLKRPPIGRNKSMISPVMWWNILGHAAYQLTVMNLIIFAAPAWLGIENGAGQGHGAKATEHNALIFNTFVLMQLFNQINSRKLHHEWNLFKGLFTGKLFLCIMAVEIAVQALIVEFGGHWFHTQSLGLTGWVLGIILAFFVFPVQFIIIWVAAVSRRLSPFRRRMTVIPVRPDAALSDEADSEVAIRMDRRESGASSLPSLEALADHVVATNLVKTKRHETSNTLAKGMTKQGEKEVKRELSKAGHEFQRQRKSLISKDVPKF